MDAGIMSQMLPPLNVVRILHGGVAAGHPINRNNIWFEPF